MYLRFTTPEKDADSNSSVGIFTAAYDLRGDPSLEPHEHTLLEEVLDWYRTHLTIPDCLRHPENRRAICWFTDKAHHSLRKIWDLVAFLKERGVVITLEKTRDPGIIIYEDHWQVVAKPRRRPKSPTT